jgi:hypothetical protein
MTESTISIASFSKINFKIVAVLPSLSVRVRCEMVQKCEGRNGKTPISNIS